MLFYCVKCRQKQEGENLQEVHMKNGKLAFKASCPICDSSMFKIGGLGDENWSNQAYLDNVPLTKGMMMDLVTNIKKTLCLYSVTL